MSINNKKKAKDGRLVILALLSIWTTGANLEGVFYPAVDCFHLQQKRSIL